MNYRPSTPFSTALVLLKPTYETVSGVEVKSFPTLSQGIPFFGSFKTYGGTEQTVNGLYSIIDTADIETWFRPDITSECRIAVAESGKVYEILGIPEDIQLRHQWLKFKVKAVRGGA